MNQFDICVVFECFLFLTLSLFYENAHEIPVYKWVGFQNLCFVWSFTATYFGSVN